MIFGTFRFAATMMLLAVSAEVHAAPNSTTIATTLGPNGEYNGNGVTPIQHFSNGFRLEHAVRFTPTGGDYFLETTRLPLFRQVDINMPLNLSIRSDAGGVPGSVIASQLYTGPFPIDTPFQQETAPPTDISWMGQNVVLRAGTPYWLHLSRPLGNFDLGWALNSIGAAGNYASRGTGNTGGDPDVWFPSNSFTTPAFAILGTPVPEPGTIALAAAAACVWTAVRRRERG